ncbi:MAG TPA: hypothetical protein VGK30_04695 [Candidatus Binatia bacterium]|jgi:hypothetical protein
MSNYFQVLKRIEKDRAGKVAALPAAEAAPAPSVAPREPAPAPPVVEERVAREVQPIIRAVPPPRPSVTTLQPMAPAAPRTPAPRPAPFVPPPVRPRSSAPLSHERQRGIATLLDKMRALGSGQSSRTFVFAGAAPSDSVHSVSDGLARHAEGFGMHVLIAQLFVHGGGHKLVAVGPIENDADRTATIDLHGPAAPDELNAWVDRVASTHDLVVLEGPPLSESIDAALLACACDGLVIVADAEVTPRAALQTAAERAHTAGCRTLGVVMSGTKERLPGWVRRLGIGGNG